MGTLRQSVGQLSNREKWVAVPVLTRKKVNTV